MGEPRTRGPDLTADRETSSDELLTAWSEIHHGIDPAGIPLVRSWLRLVHRLARPLVGIPPTAVTATGGALALAAVPVTRAGRGPARPLAGAALVLASVLCDALDGAVALQSGRVSAAGAVADRATDRVADLAFAAVLWRCGAPLGLACGAGAAALAVELPREVQGGPLRATVTVAERPTRTIATLIGCLSAAVSPARWPAAVCAAVDIATSAIGVVQLLRVRRRPR